MEIIVCIKRVPDVSEVEVEVDRSGLGIDKADLVYGINEWDNFAIEAAVQLKEAHGGKVTAITVGGEDDEEVLRRAMAMGADEALHLRDDAFEGSDGHGIATILHKAISSRPHDLVLTGAISGDDGSGHVGGMLAAKLGIRQVALATALTVDRSRATVRHEVEGGLERVVELDLPALVQRTPVCFDPRHPQGVGDGDPGGWGERPGPRPGHCGPGGSAGGHRRAVPPAPRRGRRNSRGG